MLTAEEVLQSTVWREAVERAHKRLVDQFERTDPKDSEALVDASYKLHALGVIIGELERELHKPSVNLKNR